jgi:riboflavin kinase / FMN adenylyltransferase
MIVTQDIRDLSNRDAPIVLAAGTLDGVHKGHQEVIQTAVGVARDLDGEAWVLTFEPPPRCVLHPESAPPRLSTPGQKRERIRALQPAGCLEMPFTRELADLREDEFLDLLLQHAPTLRVMVVGTNWTYGRDALGTVDTLHRGAERLGFEVRTVQPVLWKGAPVSSSRIREAVAKGEMEDALSMLGQPYSLRGTVQRGRRVGRELGFPTANLVLEEAAPPRPGIYAVTTRIGRRSLDGAAYYGRRLTFEGIPHHLMLEVHLFQPPPDLAGMTVDVSFIRFLREDRKFESVDALIAGIQDDCQQARRALQRFRRYRNEAAAC